jgi:hypothetical protein
MLLFDMLLIFSELGNMPHESMSFSVLRICSSAMHHWMSAMYSAYVERNAISVCSFLDQCSGTPAKTMINHVRDKHESRKCANYCCLTPAKSLSQYALSDFIFFWFHDEWFVSCALILVDYTFACFLCNTLGSLENRAQW